MERYIIKGGKPLEGEVEISGAKNAALGLLAAAIMTDEEVTIENLPDVSDINQLIDAIANIGAKVERVDRHTVKINGKYINSYVVEYEQMKKIRASYYLLGALLGKFKKAKVALPGGCAIGSRPIDQHLKGFRALKVRINEEHGMIDAKADAIIGNHIFLDMPSVGATINLMLAASLAEGKTTIENAAKEPHVVDVANLLNSMGANIKGAGTHKIRVYGVEKLHGTTYSTIPDQIEAGTFLCAAAATGGNVLIKNVIPIHLECITAKLVEMGCTVTEYDDAVRITAGDIIYNTQIKTNYYPGFPTDMQPQMTALLTVAKGYSTVVENIFENRFKYTGELNRMGAKIQVEGSAAFINGVSSLKGAQVSAPDLRAGAALVIAGLMADGFTIVDEIIYIQRGYEDFEGKLQALGAYIEKVDDERDIQKFKLKVG